MSIGFSKFTNFSLNIRGRLIAGFAVLTFLLVAAVGTTLWKVDSIETEVNDIVELRVPSAFASAGLINDINASLASLRGWMLTGNVAFKVERVKVWADIADIRANMDRLSASWTVPANVAKWAEFKTVLDEFEIAQQQAATETGTAAAQVLSATGELANQAVLLRKEVEDFLAQVRAA